MQKGTSRRVAALSTVLFGLNAFICWRLFRTEYLRNLDSIEGTFITFAKFVLEQSPHTAWFPWFNAGLPFENTYLPLPAYLTAIVAVLTRTSPAHAFHSLTALAYSTAPVFLFLFARDLSGKIAPSFWAALLWTLFSPSVIFPQSMADLGTHLGMRRLANIVIYGEVPHNLALCLLPVALWAASRYWTQPGPRRFALAVLMIAAVMLANAFGIVAVSLSVVILLAARSPLRRKDVVSTFALLVVAYLLICRYLPPSLIALIRVNSQLAGGDYRFTAKTNLIGAVFAIALCALWFLTRRIPDMTLRFAVLFTLCFGGITFLAYRNINFIPQPQRYQLEMEAGVCLAISFALAPLLGRIPRSTALICAVVCAVGLGWIFWQDLRYARRITHPIDISKSAIFHQARWIQAHLPGERIMVSGVADSWFNLFTDNPQLSGGHDPFAPNWMQRVAVFTIYSGQNAGNRDAEFSILWLKAFGCGAITVPGPASEQPINTLSNPRKFDGVLPLLWREGDDSVYRVPLRSTSLAHVIPASAVVSRRPEHGLDIEPVRAYVAALDDPAIPPASLYWDNPERGRVSAIIGPSQVVSVQITYDAGWRASIAGRPAKIYSDQLGMMIIDPLCSGNCVIDLEFAGGWERRICFLVSLLTVIALLAMLAIRPPHANGIS
jgi:hypothetical protein